MGPESPLLGTSADVAVLQVEDVQVRYGGVLALAGCSFAVGRGCTALIGPNGSGKTTLLDVICGYQRASRGRVTLQGKPLAGPPHKRARSGIYRTFQLPQMFGRMTVLENVMVASDGLDRKQWRRALLGPRSWRQAEAQRVVRAREVVRQLHLEQLMDERADSLSGGQKKLVEFGRGIMTDARLMLLDEPFAGVAKPLADELSALVKGLVAGGVTIVLVEHEMARVRELADSVTVMAGGQVVRSGSFESVRDSEGVRSLYLGRDTGSVSR